MLRPLRALAVRAVVASAVVASALVARAVAAPPAPAAAPPRAPVPAHDSFTVQSRAVGEARRVNVHVPAAYAGSRTTRFPVLYMPDGGLDEDFPHVVHTVDSLVAAGAIRPVLVVGIPNTERRRDLTGPTRVAAYWAVAPHVGGSAAFRRFIREELIPAVDARYRTTRERAIMGESLAGPFVVRRCSRRRRCSTITSRSTRASGGTRAPSSTPPPRGSRRWAARRARSTSRTPATTARTAPRASRRSSGRRPPRGSRSRTRRVPTSRTRRSSAP